MEQPPEFLLHREIVNSRLTFRPATPNRRGEFIAWACAGGIAVVLAILTIFGGRAPLLVVLLMIFFSWAGGMISFGNWLDARTQVVVTPTAISYTSPLRKVRLTWRQVEQLRVVPATSGRRLTVVGSRKYFNLRLGQEVGGRLGKKLSIGFPEGERLAKIVIGMSRLSRPVWRGHAWVCARAAEPDGG